ncbi:hypothetical protein KKY_1095 [Pelagibacterium halotolerans B2]|uniref:Uncharacterized protein n=1 Tax=Pelagibacterium halotolerans (strain DSM 22347 / JCM 15775 / CGMCC 1.7692 / B2) TaxID=1082931 RepID=G4R613_PELHB|nr:hypothetical protein KKY_1095 [Pelagibacterium halotolerans B2]
MHGDPCVGRTAGYRPDGKLGEQRRLRQGSCALEHDASYHARRRAQSGQTGNAARLSRHASATMVRQFWG